MSVNIDLFQVAIITAIVIAAIHLEHRLTKLEAHADSITKQLDRVIRALNLNAGEAHE